jgi:serine/threonine protein kinase
MMMLTEKSQADFVDFIDKCLEWKPEKRMTPQQGFEHAWIQAGLKELGYKIKSEVKETTSPTSPEKPGVLPRIKQVSSKKPPVKHEPKES